MRIGMTGGRDSVLSYHQIDEFLRLMKTADTFVHGGARGADRFCAGLVDMKFPFINVMEITPNYSIVSFSKIAPIIRNKQIVDNSDILIVFHGGNGTANCKKQALLWNVPVVDLSGLK